MNHLLKYCILSALSIISSASFAQADKTGNNNSANASNGFKYILHKGETRGQTDAGWLLARHTFTFNNYCDPDRMNFGVLRVLNDDRINPGSKFPTHPHNNMEIITIPLSGSVEHKDNMGNQGVIHAGDIQVMSAGTGITHSEANHSLKDTLRLLQIWVFPDRKNVTPRYQQTNGITNNLPANGFKKLIAPNESSTAFIYQNTVFSMGKFSKLKKAEYPVAFKGNGVYAFILEGSAKINGIQVNRRDGIGIWETDKLYIEATEDLQILLMDVPLID